MHVGKRCADRFDDLERVVFDTIGAGPKGADWGKGFGKGFATSIESDRAITSGGLAASVSRSPARARNSPTSQLRS
jgi:hypothetical protein